MTDMVINQDVLRIPSGVLSTIVVTGNRLYFPVTVNVSDYLSLYKEKVLQSTPSSEKAIYIAMVHGKKQSIHSRSMFS